MQPPSLLDFSDLSHPHESKKTERSLRLLKASTELSARVLETHSSLESGVEIGVDATLSTSHNERTGEQLMEQHIGRGAVEGGGLVSPTSAGPHMGGEGSAFFKPISSMETDEEKLVQERGKMQMLIKPTPAPRIFLNEDELRLSPLSPHPPLGQQAGGKA